MGLCMLKFHFCVQGVMGVQGKFRPPSPTPHLAFLFQSEYGLNKFISP